MGTSLWCRECRKTKNHSMYRGNWFKYNGSTVKTCTSCGHLRTRNDTQVVEGEMVHKPTGKKMKKLKQENYFEDGENDE